MTRIFSFMLEGSDIARHVISILISRSMWFSVTPFPRGYFEISVKGEHEDLLKHITSKVREAMQ